MAGRHEKTRRVGVEPEYLGFIPEGHASGSDVVLAVDELEALRLTDLERMSQTEAAERMGVARATVAAICARAHAKVADALVNGRCLRIAGGNVAYAPAKDRGREPWPVKEERAMRIAVTYDNGNVFQHFGKTEQFKIYDAEEGKVVSAQVVGSNGAGHGALAGVLAAGGVNVLICGGIGGGAINALAQRGIRIVAGASGSCDEVVETFLAGALVSADGPTCGCHGHGDEGHECGDHGCGDHEGHECGCH